MIMAHKGRVVFEAYPGMNPTDMHIWMSASKTTFGLMVMYLEADGKVDMEKPITAYATQLKGTAWDKVSLKNAMNMATGLDIEESFANLTNPKSWIGKFFTAMMSTGAAGDWIQVMREAEPLPGEPAGTYMRYSTAITQALALVVENVSNLSYADYFQKRVWSKLGVKDPFLVALLSDKTALAGGGNFTAIEDFLRYAMIYTPSWKKVSEERIVTDALLKRIQTLGDPKAFEGCTEQQYGHEWFGELAERNSAQWDDVFADGAMFKHGNMGQGIYVDPARDFCGVHFALGPNDGPVDWSPGYQRAAAKMFAGG
jgi:CubicO group peptidase (beta-lactamase class C family)